MEAQTRYFTDQATESKRSLLLPDVAHTTDGGT